MNSRRDEQYERQQFGRHNAEYDERYRDDESNTMRGRGQEDGRPDSQRGWDREGFGGSWRTEGLGGRLDEQGRMSDPRGYDRLRRDSTSYGGYGYGGYSGSVSRLLVSRPLGVASSWRRVLLASCPLGSFVLRGRLANREPRRASRAFAPVRSRFAGS